MESKTPNWAYAMLGLTIIFFPLALLWLLVKEKVVRGYVEINVQSSPMSYLTQVPVRSLDDINEIHERVYRAQQLAAAAEISPSQFATGWGGGNA